MRGAAVIDGGRRLLFERLVHDPHAPAADAVHDLDSLSASIAVEVDRLFNTRLPLDAARLARRRRGTLDYGIPDLSLFPPRDPGAEAELARHLAEALRAFEPRLNEPAVTLERTEGPQGGLVAHISGQVRLERLIAPLNFTVALRRHGG